MALKKKVKKKVTKKKVTKKKVLKKKVPIKYYLYKGVIIRIIELLDIDVNRAKNYFMTFKMKAGWREETAIISKEDFKKLVVEIK